MKRILIGVLLVILATSYIVQREQIIKRINALRDRQVEQVVVTEKAKVRQPQQQVELLAYPPPEESWPYVPPPDYSHETPTSPLDLLPPPPTLAPTMPVGD